MTYQHSLEMNGSMSLHERIIVAAAQSGKVSDPANWVLNHKWAVLAQDPAWLDKWSEAVAKWTPEYNPDTGARPGVITDAAIRKAVDAVLKQQADDAEKAKQEALEAAEKERETEMAHQRAMAEVTAAAQAEALSRAQAQAAEQKPVE